jgi:hypothetical protein
MALRKLIFQTLEGGGLFIGDVIEHQGKLWLVPEWLAGPTKGTARPARIICLDGLPLSKRSQHQDHADWALSTPLSTEILEGREASQSPLVIERPDIFLHIDTDFHR